MPLAVGLGRARLQEQPVLLRAFYPSPATTSVSWSHAPRLVLASLFLQAMYGGILNGATEPTSRVTSLVACLTEGILTLGLVSAILGTATGARNVGIAGAIAVGA